MPGSFEALVRKLPRSVWEPDRVEPRLLARSAEVAPGVRGG